MTKKFKIFQPSFFERYLGSFQYIEINKSNVKIYRENSLIRNFLNFRNAKSDVLDMNVLEDFPILKLGLLSSSLIFKVPGKEMLVKGISNNRIDYDYKFLIETYSKYFEKKLKNWWKEVKLNTEDRFLRDSMIHFVNNIVDIVNNIYQTRKHLIKEYLSSSITNLFTNFLKYYPIENHIEQIRYKFEQNNLKLKKEFFANLESYPLTEEQSLSIIRDNDKNLILAAAGTGKTSVIVGKALDIVLNQGYEDSEVLVLAYGRSASEELNERIQISKDNLLKNSVIFKQKKSCNIRTSTFHKLGRDILIESKKSFVVSELADNPLLKLRWFEEQLQKYIKDNPTSITPFIFLLNPSSNQFDFDDQEKYKDYLQDNPYYSLAGEKVRSYQELLIANWLYKNGIKYHYEPNYEKKENVQLDDFSKTYNPDFMIEGETNIYIEHFGLNCKGETLKGIDPVKYKEEREWKKKTHKKHGTILIETFSCDWEKCGKNEMEFEKLLDQRLSKYVSKKPKPFNELYDELKEKGNITEFSKILSEAVSAIRIENISMKEAEKRLNKSKYTHTEKLLPFLENLKNAYQSKLKNDDEIDFDDMILQATECVKNGEFKSKWKFILVDEFQDISQSRMDLLKAISESVNDDTSLFTVGDDWQSIYRFSGGKLELTTRYDSLIGAHSVTKLQKTFRYNNSVANVAGKFIMKNPEQYEKDVITQNNTQSHSVKIMDIIDKAKSLNNNKKIIKDEPLKVLELVTRIKNYDHSASIFILARYNFVLKEIREFLKPHKFINIHYLTFHRSKGMEADYCILTGFSDGINKLGFPNENVEHVAIEALLPTLDSYEHSEERRLMYVALTRTRNECFILADPFSKSKFIKELIYGNYEIDIDSKYFEEEFQKIYQCALCNYGFLETRKNDYGEFYGCNTYPECGYIAKSCEDCGAPTEVKNNIRQCKDSECNYIRHLCLKCNRVMVKRQRKKDGVEFFGCSGYGLSPPDQCDFTMNLDGPYE